MSDQGVAHGSGSSPPLRRDSCTTVIEVANTAAVRIVKGESKPGWS